MRPVIAALWRDARGALGFFTRLPVRCDDAEPSSLRMAPVAGVVVGTVGGLTIGLATLANLSPSLAALTCVLALIVTTGALHEDGLADLCDALGARSRERRLDIMRDSRIGTYGVCALAVSLMLRVVLIAGLIEVGGTLGVTAVIAGEALSRTLCLWPLYRLPPARDDGLGAWTGGVSGARIAFAGTLTIPVLVGATFAIGWIAIAVATLAAFAIAELTTRAARRLIGGQTGDVAGATQQLSSLAFLYALTICIANI